MNPGSSTGAISHRDTFRHSVPTRTGAYWVLLIGCAVFSVADVYPFPVWSIAGVTVFETLVLAVVYRRAETSAIWAGSYLVFEGVCQTLIFYVSGDLRIAFAPIVYTFELLNPGLRLSRTGHFIVANAFGALFAGMIVAERLGGLPTTTTPELIMSTPVRTSTIVIMCLCLNVAAFFISGARGLLESRSAALELARRGLQEHSVVLEERVRMRTEELEKSYRALEVTTSELRTFIYNVTHDLKNPLNAIALTAELLVERTGEMTSADVVRELTEISRTAKHGETMLQDLLNVFRITSIEEVREWVDTGTMVEGAVALLRAQIKERDVRIVSDRIPSVWGQPKKLQHAVTNLLANAIRHVPRHTGVIEVSGGRDGSHVTVRIRDNGVGIPPEYHQRIFELFGRVPSEDGDGPTSSVQGTGVGLALVKRIVEDHGGLVWVESREGSGSTFVVRLPREGEPTPTAT